MSNLTRTAIAATIRRATFAAHGAVEQLDVDTISSLERIYRGAADDIEARIRAAAGGGELALQDLRSVLGQVESRLKDLSAARNALLDQTLAIGAELGVQPYTAAAVLTNAAAMQVSHDALLFVRTFVAADGLQLSDRLWRLDRGARDAVVNQIERSVIEGHSASQAAREFLNRGQPVPIEVITKQKAANGAEIGRQTTTQLLTGKSNPKDQALRLFRTELNRAHGEAYMKGGEKTPGFAGWRYLLSPAHPEPDICDLLSEQNLYGLGRGVYPDRESLPWPAHPNTLSFVVIVFDHEITDADRAGKETPTQALARLTAAQREGVLGKGKAEIFDRGQLTQGMIRTPLARVRDRIGTPLTPPPRPAPKLPAKAPAKAAPAKPKAAPPSTLNEMIKAGKKRTDAMLKAIAATPAPADLRFPERLLAELREVRDTGKAAALRTRGRGAELVKAASLLFPDDWTKIASSYGKLEARFRDGRAFYRPGIRGSDPMILVRDPGSAVHEYTHHLQHAMPRLDDYFQELHARRTKGQPLKDIGHVTPELGYTTGEVTREDKYVTPYQGREYPAGAYLGQHGALEVMTMAFEAVLGGRRNLLQRMLKNDREMVNLVVGLLFNYVP